MRKTRQEKVVLKATYVGADFLFPISECTVTKFRVCSLRNHPTDEAVCRYQCLYARAAFSARLLASSLPCGHHIKTLPANQFLPLASSNLVSKFWSSPSSGAFSVQLGCIPSMSNPASDATSLFWKSAVRPEFDTSLLQSYLLSAVGWLARHERRHITAG